jgi:D-alanine-D-alanine ligase
MPKTIVGVIFGGRSVEHEVSIVTAQQVIENIDKAKYEVVPIYIAKSGEWYTGAALLDMKKYKDLAQLLAKSDKVFLQPASDGDHLQYMSQRKSLFGRPKSQPLDVIFPAMHGTFGEDGCLQGL